MYRYDAARFRLESRLVSEAAYFYTNLVSATHFLTTVGAVQVESSANPQLERRLVSNIEPMT